MHIVVQSHACIRTGTHRCIHIHRCIYIPVSNILIFKPIYRARGIHQSAARPHMPARILQDGPLQLRHFLHFLCTCMYVRIRMIRIRMFLCTNTYMHTYKSTSVLALWSISLCRRRLFLFTCVFVSQVCTYVCVHTSRSPIFGDTWFMQSFICMHDINLHKHTCIPT
jgi:hypothetical protein